MQKNSLYQASGDLASWKELGRRRRKRCVSSRTCQRLTLPWPTIIIVAAAITRALSESWRLPEPVCLTISDVFLVIGSIERRQGKWTESIAHLEKAASLDPMSQASGPIWAPVIWRCATLSARPDPSIAVSRPVRNSSSTTGYVRQLEIDRKGDLAFGEQVIERIAAMPDPDGQIALARFQLKLMQRKYGEALDVLSRSDLLGCRPGDHRRQFRACCFSGQVNRLLGDQDRAQPSFEAARQMMERAVAENPTDASRHALLGEAYAGLGRKEDALREGKRAVELLPESKDALDGPDMTLALSAHHCMLGETEPALALLEHLFAIPGGISAYRLKLDPDMGSAPRQSTLRENVNLSYHREKET
jgi:serine/threonine-protein kinase